jgi:hypothetical protein
VSNTTSSIDPGSSPSLPVAVDSISSALYQRNKQVDPTEGSTSAIGVDANPWKVKPRRFGTSDYDSGRIVAPSSATQITATTTYVERILLTNLTDTERSYTLTNAADAEVISQYPIAPRMSVVLDLGGMAIAGLKHLASAGSAVAIQIVGAQ